MLQTLRGNPFKCGYEARFETDKVCKISTSVYLSPDAY